MDFFTFWVSELWGNSFIALIALCFLYFGIGVAGRMGYMLLLSMMCLVIIVFGTAFYGMLFWLPILLFAVVYFLLQLYNFIQRSS